MRLVIDSSWFVQGPQHMAFEREFGELLGGVSVAGVASGTDALELALRVLSPRPGVVVFGGLTLTVIIVESAR